MARKPKRRRAAPVTTKLAGGEDRRIVQVQRRFVVDAPISDLGTLNRATIIGQQRFYGLLPYWRGHGSIDWSLTAEVFRSPAPGKSHPEVTLIRHFMAQAESRVQRCPAYNDFVG